MNASAYLPLRWLRPAIFGAIMLLLGGNPLKATAQPIITSATTTNGIPLEALLKKWEMIPLDEIERLATNGDLTAQHYLGYCNAEGFRISRNLPAGVVWYERALRGGYLPAANNLGFLYQRGSLGTNDMAQAVRYYTFAAERGYGQSQVNLGILYHSGDGIPRDTEAAMKWFRPAAEGGHTTAMVEIGRLYRFGQGVPTNFPEARKWFELAADKGSSLGQFNLGLLYAAEGQPTEAARAVQKAADQGSTDAMTELYCYYWEGRGVPSDEVKAMEWLTKAAEAKNPRAEYLMGFRCNDERYVKPDKALEAFQWFRRSAEQNFANGLHHLGLCYLEGEVVERDEARALELIRSAADTGVTEAMKDLAGVYARGIGEPRDAQDRPMALLRRAGAWEDMQMRYQYGLGTAPDLIAAARCYTKLLFTGSSYYYSSADLLNYIEFKPRPRSLGTRLLLSPDDYVHVTGPSEGINHIPQDNVLRALSLYLKSVQGDAVSAERIGELYQAGNGADQSLSKAWAWFSVAGETGSSTGREKAAKLAAQISESDMASARDYLRELREDMKQVATVVRK